MVRKHPEVREELLAVQDALLQFSAAEARAPRPGLEQRILDQLGASPQAAPAMPAEARRTFHPNAWMGLLMAASLAAAVYFYQASQAKTTELEATQAELAQLQTDCENIRQSNDELANYFAVVRNKDNQPVAMNGTPLSPEALAVVFWNPNEKTAYLDIRNLPAPPPDKQYQLWAIVDGKPTDMGVFDIATGELALQDVPFIENPQAFAVTLENKGGSPTPTLDQMYVVGNVGT